MIATMVATTKFVVSAVGRYGARKIIGRRLAPVIRRQQSQRLPPGGRRYLPSATGTGTTEFEGNDKSSSFDDSTTTRSASTTVRPPATAFSSGPVRSGRKISLNVQEMADEDLILLSSFEDHDAREEILKRHSMDTDDINYEEATEIFLKIEEKNREGMYLMSLPYRIGIVGAVTMGFLSIPMVFHLPTIEWFNEWAVTTDHPDAIDLETPLEVSIWSWSWMEPPLGTFSFILLCSQYAR